MGGVVMHSCDNPPCVNPEHLSLGTHADNMRDKAEKGRCNAALGEQLPQSKLTKDTVRECRLRYKPRCPVNGQAALSREYGVDQSTMSKALSGVTWTHIK